MPVVVDQNATSSEAYIATALNTQQSVLQQ